MPVNGGTDRQPVERLTQMLFAERVRQLFEKQRLSKKWSEDMTEGDSELMSLIYADG